MKNCPKFGPSIQWGGPADINHYGYFSKVKPTINFESCRERFQVSMVDPKTRSIFYSFGPQDTPDNRYALACFIHKTETILGVKRKTTYNEVYKKDGTYYRSVLKINVAKFWKAEYLRSSLFTALVRVGAGHLSAGSRSNCVPYDPEKDNYETCLFTNPNMKVTLTAVKRFLCGFTHYTGERPYPPGHTGVQSVGWNSLMTESNGNIGKGWKLLVKPKDDYKNIIAAGKFWG